MGCHPWLQAGRPLSGLDLSIKYMNPHKELFGVRVLKMNFFLGKKSVGMVCEESQVTNLKFCALARKSSQII